MRWLNNIISRSNGSSNNSNRNSSTSSSSGNSSSSNNRMDENIGRPKSCDSLRKTKLHVTHFRTQFTRCGFSRARPIHFTLTCILLDVNISKNQSQRLHYNYVRIIYTVVFSVVVIRIRPCIRATVTKLCYCTNNIKQCYRRQKRNSTKATLNS